MLVAGQVGARQTFWFNLTDDMLDLEGTERCRSRRSCRRTGGSIGLPHSVEVSLLREQLLVRAPGARLVFPIPTGKQWDRSGFRETRVDKSVEAAATPTRRTGRDATVFDGFTFHMLRHTAGSLMALAGTRLRPSPRSVLGHTDGGRCSSTYRHLYEGEKRAKLTGWTLHVCELGRGVDSETTRTAINGSTTPILGDGRTWDRTRDLPRVKRALSR